jgi:DNA-directed RNA polymerase subunit RPC12/RpoP
MAQGQKMMKPFQNIQCWECNHTWDIEDDSKFLKIGDTINCEFCGSKITLDESCLATIDEDWRK